MLSLFLVKRQRTTLVFLSILAALLRLKAVFIFSRSSWKHLENQHKSWAECFEMKFSAILSAALCTFSLWPLFPGHYNYLVRLFVKRKLDVQDLFGWVLFLSSWNQWGSWFGESSSHLADILCISPDCLPAGRTFSPVYRRESPLSALKKLPRSCFKFYAQTHTHTRTLNIFQRKFSWISTLEEHKTSFFLVMEIWTLWYFFRFFTTVLFKMIINTSRTETSLLTFHRGANHWRNFYVVITVGVVVVDDLRVKDLNPTCLIKKKARDILMQKKQRNGS